MKRSAVVSVAAFVVAGVLAFCASYRSRVIAPLSAPAIVPPLPRANVGSRLDFLKQLRRLDPASLPDLYAACADTPERQDMLARYWAEVDPAGFLAYLAPKDSAFFRHDRYAVYAFDRWAAADFPAALAAAHALSPFNPARAEILRRVVAVRLARDPALAIAALADIYGNAGTMGGSLEFEKDPWRYLPELAKLPSGALRETAIQRAMRSWATEDPKAAYAWLEANYSPKEFVEARSSFLSDLAGKTPALAAELTKEIPSSHARAIVLRNIGKHLARHDPDGTIAYIEEQVGGYYREATARHAANEIAERDAVAGADFALRFRDPDLRKAAISEALDEFHKRDQAGLARWAEALPAGPPREEVQAKRATLR